MGLELGSSGGTRGAGEEFMPKAYIEEVEIVHAIDMSKKPIFEGSDDVFDLALELGLKSKAYENPFRQTLRGNFKYEDGQVVGFGGAFLIDSLLKQMGLYKLMNDDEKAQLQDNFESSVIPKSVRAFLVGKKVHKISYVSGVKADDPKKFAYKTYNQLFVDKDAGIKAFQYDVENNEYIQKNYNPDAETESDGFQYGANVEQKAEEDSVI